MNSRWSSLSVSLFKGVAVPLCISSGANVLIYGQTISGADSRPLQFLQPFVFSIGQRKGCLIFHTLGAPRHVSDGIEACARFRGPLDGQSNILLSHAICFSQAPTLQMWFHVGSLDGTRAFPSRKSLSKPSALSTPLVPARVILLLVHGPREL